MHSILIYIQHEEATFLNFPMALRHYGRCPAERAGSACVAFYNLENLFDTIHDAGKNDLEFLPSGSCAWTAEKYEAKLKNLAKVLNEVSRDRVPEGPAVIGVAEAENNRY